FVVVWRSMPVLFRIVTLALAIVAPDGSLIKPEILPRSDCASNPCETSKAKHTARIHLRKELIIRHPIARRMKLVPGPTCFPGQRPCFLEHRPGVETTLPALRYSILAMLEIPVR